MVVALRDSLTKKAMDTKRGTRDCAIFNRKGPEFIAFFFLFGCLKLSFPSFSDVVMQFLYKRLMCYVHKGRREKTSLLYSAHCHLFSRVFQRSCKWVNLEDNANYVRRLKGQ